MNEEMNMNGKNEMNNQYEKYSFEIQKIKKKKGIVELSDDELLLLAFDEISNTYTHDEKKYSL